MHTKMNYFWREHYDDISGRASVIFKLKQINLSLKVINQ